MSALVQLANVASLAATKATNVLFLIVGVVLALLILILLWVIVTWGKLYLQALSSGARVGFIDLIGMWLRHVSAGLIVENRISAAQAGVNVSTRDLESVYLVRRNPDDVRVNVTAMITAHKAALPVTFGQLQAHHFAGGNVLNLVNALIAATRARINLDFDVARAIDLAGRDVLDAVQTSVNPKVIDCPSVASGKGTIDAVAQDGIQLKAKARVTVRANIERLVGGATEETIIARVGEGIVTTIGSAASYKAVLENPDQISKKVLEKGLDAGTAFEILSIDIADVDVGDNIGAKLQAEQADADKIRFQAEAEKRRAMAAARTQEMSAMVEENRAKVVLAEAEIPKAMAEAFRSGNLGIMDYYRLRNIQADTSMRETIGKADQAGPRQQPKT